MNSSELRDYAENRDITVIDGALCKDEKSLSLIDLDYNNICTIVIDNDKIHTEQENNVIMAHEIGHCETGAFYNERSLELRSRMEYRADKWAIKKLVPEDELIEMFEKGITETWELAEYFDVTEDFMIKACEFYGFYHRAI